MSELADLCPKRDRDEDEDELTIPRAAMNKMIKEVLLWIKCEYKKVNTVWIFCLGKWIWAVKAASIVNPTLIM